MTNSDSFNSTCNNQPSNDTFDTLKYNNNTNMNGTQSTTFPQICPEQAIEQLKLLGYGEGDTVYLRFIHSSSKSDRTYCASKWMAQTIEAELVIGSDWQITYVPWETKVQIGGTWANGNPKTKKVRTPEMATRYWAQAIEKHNRSGYGIYFVINKGGTDDKSITNVVAGYFEVDDLSIADQWKLIDSFGLTPSFVVETGKSLHTYFSFKSNTMTSEEWKEQVQKPFIMAMNSDPSIQNPSRVMRLAGFNHVKFNADNKTFKFKLCTIQAVTDSQYSPEEVSQAALAFAGLAEAPSFARYQIWLHIRNAKSRHAVVAAEIGFDFDQKLQEVLSLPEDALGAFNRRWEAFNKLCNKRAKGADVNPLSAWTDAAKKLPSASLPTKRAVVEAEDFDGELGDSDTIRWAQYLYGYNPNGRPNWITAQCPSVAEADRDNHSIDSLHIHKVTGAIKSQRGVDSKAVWEMMKEIAEKAELEAFKAEQDKLTAENAKVWEALKGCHRKPDVILNQRYINLKEIVTEKNVIYVVKSAKNTGKTTASNDLLKGYDSVMSLYSRIAQAEEQCERIGVEFKNKPNWKMPTPKVGCVINSIIHHDPAMLTKNGILVGDEANQIFDHILGSTCNGKRQAIYHTFYNFMKAALVDGNVLLMSADIKNRDMELIEELATSLGAKVVYVENQYQFDLGTLNVITDKDPYSAIEFAVSLMKQGKKLMIPTDIKGGVCGAKTLAEYFRTLFPEKNIVEIHGDTSGDPIIKDYIRNINTSSLTTDLLIVSPSLTNGVSIDNGQFDSVVAILNGVLTVDDATQQMSRLRNCQDVWVWAKEQGIGADGFSLTPEHKKATVEAMYDEYKALITETMAEIEYTVDSRSFSSPWLSHYYKSVAYRNNCMVNFRDKLVEKALEDGFSSVNKVELGKGKDIQVELKEVSEQMEIRDARAVAAARTLGNSELEYLMLQDRKTSEEAASISKTLLEKSYGEAIVAQATLKVGEEVLTGHSALYLMDKNRSMKKGLDLAMFALLENGKKLAAEKDLRNEGFDFKEKLFSSERSVLNMRYYSLAVKLLVDEFRIRKFLTPDVWFVADDFYKMFDKAKSEKYNDKFRNLLGLNPRSCKAAVHFFTELMSKLGMTLERKTINGVRSVRISEASWQLFQLYLEFKAPNESTVKIETEVKDGAQKLLKMVASKNPNLSKSALETIYEEQLVA